jgi:hypothetical protein
MLVAHQSGCKRSEALAIMPMPDNGSQIEATFHGIPDGILQRQKKEKSLSESVT